MVTIKVAKTRREIRDFVLFPTELYKNDPYYVPDMVGDQINDLMPDKNPAFEYCEARCFLAYRDGKIPSLLGRRYENELFVLRDRGGEYPLHQGL